MQRMLSFVAAGGVCLAVSGGVIAKPSSFAEIAPSDTAVLVNIPNFSAVKASFERTGLMDLWNDPSLRQWFENFAADALEDIESGLEEFNVTMDDLRAPQGMAGSAVWISAPEGDPEAGVINFMMAGDFGDDADTMAETVATMIERIEDEGNFTISYDDFGDHEITVLTRVDAGDDDGWENPADSMEPDALHYVRSGSVLMMGTSLTAIENALDALGGRDIDSAADSADLAATLAQHPGGVQAYAALLNKPLFSLTQRLADMDESMIPLDMLEKLGLLEVRAASIGLNMEPRAGMMEQTFGVLVGQKKGLLTLIDVPPARFQPPAFANADAASVGMYQFNISGLLPLLRQVVEGSEDPNMQMMAGQLPMIEQTVGPILNSLGTRIYAVQSFTRPLSATSERNLVAIDLKSRDEFMGALAGFAPMLGMEARDFQGNQIWAMPDGGGMMLPIDIAIAAAGNFAYFGSPQAIEDALRQADRAGGLAQEEAFTSAMSAVANEGLSFGWTDMRQTLRHAEWMWKNQEAIIRERVTAMFGDDPEFDDWRKEMIEEELANMPEWMKNPPNIDAILKHVGNTVFEFEITDDGIRGRSVWLKPAN
ncbi:MAG: hypothetical protein ACTS3F_04265 [Phycisphaerales bacterium]